LISKDIKIPKRKKYIEATFAENDLIELKPFGLVNGFNPTRPIFLFKDKFEKEVFPVWMEALDAGILHAMSHGEGQKTYLVQLEVLESFGIQYERCVFTKLDGYRLYANMYFRRDGQLQVIPSRADHVINLGIVAKTRFYAPQDLIAQVKDVQQNKDLTELSKDSAVKNPQKYLC
jgi:bifunctional DNase/RNase